jgi:hypothetical protein
MTSEGRVVQGEVKSAGHSELQPGDIIFECPQCGKSLAIDVRGAGYIVRCPGCQAEIRVPGIAPPSAVQGGDEVVNEPDVETPAGTDSSEALIAEISRLKHKLSLEAERKSRISAELALIQAAIDRIVGLLEDSPPPNNP